MNVEMKGDSRPRHHSCLAALTVVLLLSGLLTILALPEPLFCRVYEHARLAVKSVESLRIVALPLNYFRNSQTARRLNTQRYERVLRTLARIQQKVESQHLDLMEINDALGKLSARKLSHQIFETEVSKQHVPLLDTPENRTVVAPVDSNNLSQIVPAFITLKTKNESRNFLEPT